MREAEVLDARPLMAVPLFAACSELELESVASSLEAVVAPAGTVLFREGDPGTEMYVIAAGEVRIVSDVDTEKLVFAHLGPGDFFGEMALMTGEPRSAAAIATTDVELWRLGADGLQQVLSGNPQVGVEIGRILGQRVARGNLCRFENEAFPLLSLTPERGEFTIGRWGENDLVLADPQVAGVHARIERRDGRWFIRDEGTEAGTYVNRRRVTLAELGDGDEIRVGTRRIFLDGLTVKSFIGREGVRIDAAGLVKVVGGKQILQDVSLSIYPGEFVAIVGGSGTGKTSLLHALNGFSPATAGGVRYNGLGLYENIDLFRPVLGYLPQDDIVHRELTVERTLHYSARLRLPPDTTADEIRERTEEALTAVGLTDRRRAEVRSLSGGQRKRVSVAVELLARPKAFFLDEPTSGLDPALDGRLMALFRELAENGATVIISTHATQNLRLCDKIAWMGRGGRLVFFGSPAEALRHFSVAQFSEIYDLLEAADGLEYWLQAFPDSPAHRFNVAGRLGTHPDRDGSPSAGERHRGAGGGGASLRRQFYWLSVRYMEVLVRDTRNLALLLLQAPAIALALLLLFDRRIYALSASGGGDAYRAMMALHMMTASAIWLGASNAAREITKEAAIYSRERLVNLRVLPYLLSKVAVLSLLCLIQSAVMLAIFAARVDLSGLGWSVYPSLLGVISLTALGGLGMGLLVSAVAGNSDRAMAIVPILLIPEIMFAGAQVPLVQMLGPARGLSQLMVSKWSLELAGHVTGLSTRFAAQFPPAIAGPYQTAFDVTPWTHWLALPLFALVLLLATFVAQTRKDAR